MKELTDAQKIRIIDTLSESLKESYGDVRDAIESGLPKVFEVVKKGEEYEGNIVLMFCQDEVKKLIDNGYKWEE